jgi:alcohol dehydrogenase (cytochrome c)
MKDITEPEERMEQIDKGPVAQEDEVTLNQKVPGDTITEEQLLNDYENPASWLQYNGNYQQTGDSAVTRISPDTVESLEEAYRIETDTKALETNPVIVPGGDSNPPVMYLTQNNQVIKAVNARTGELFWEFNYSPRREDHAYGGVNRGVAVWKDTVLFGAMDVRLLALDRYTGELKWETDFLMEEQVDEMTNVAKRIGFTHTPLVLDGHVFLGQSSDYAGWTAISVIDANSGDIVTQHRTGPKSEWIGESWRFASSAMWMSPAVDPQTNTVFVTTANPDPMFLGTVRPGPNKHSNSIIALDASTGEIKWTNQIFAHELWDYDIGAAVPYVFDARVDDEERRLVGVDNKTAWSYFVDAETGELVDRSNAWGIQQHQFGSWPESEFLNLPPMGKENRAPMRPVVTGATEWPSNSLSRRTGLRYIGVNDASQTLYANPDWKVEDEPSVAYGGTVEKEEGYDNKGYVVALDPASGTVKWRSQVPDVDPEASAVVAFLGGTTATAGGVVFVGSPGGSLYAYDDETGNELWSGDTGGRITAVPVVWDDPAEGKAYVSIASDDSVVVYALEAGEA